MSGSLVLITGATGMVGFRVLVTALEAGYRTRIAVRKPGDFERLQQLAPIRPYVDQTESIVVPDITEPHAYDVAALGVEYIIHTASPVAIPPVEDFDRQIITPARLGTIRILEAASSQGSGVKRIVMTASIAAIVPAQAMLMKPEDTIFTEKNRVLPPVGPYNDLFEAYMASKAIALKATEDFVREKSPSFDVINIGPGFVIGRDDTVTKSSLITKGSNGIAFSQLLGHPQQTPFASTIVHINDVGLLHVKALDPSIPGNQFFLATTEGPEGADWADALEVVRKHYPEEIASGVLRADAGTPTLRMRVDASYTERIFGIKFKTYEEAIVSVVDHFLDLLDKETQKSS